MGLLRKVNSKKKKKECERRNFAYNNPGYSPMTEHIANGRKEHYGTNRYPYSNPYQNNRFQRGNMIYEGQGEFRSYSVQDTQAFPSNRQQYYNTSYSTFPFVKEAGMRQYGKEEGNQNKSYDGNYGQRGNAGFPPDRNSTHYQGQNRPYVPKGRIPQVKWNPDKLDGKHHNFTEHDSDFNSYMTLENTFEPLGHLDDKIYNINEKVTSLPYQSDVYAPTSPTTLNSSSKDPYFTNNYNQKYNNDIGENGGFKSNQGYVTGQDINSPTYKNNVHATPPHFTNNFQGNVHVSNEHEYNNNLLHGAVNSSNQSYYSVQNTPATPYQNNMSASSPYFINNFHSNAQVSNIPNHNSNAAINFFHNAHLGNQVHNVQNMSHELYQNNVYSPPAHFTDAYQGNGNVNNTQKYNNTTNSFHDDVYGGNQSQQNMASTPYYSEPYTPVFQGGMENNNNNMKLGNVHAGDYQYDNNGGQMQWSNNDGMNEGAAYNTNYTDNYSAMNHQPPYYSDVYSDPHAPMMNAGIASDFHGNQPNYYVNNNQPQDPTPYMNPLMWDQQQQGNVFPFHGVSDVQQPTASEPKKVKSASGVSGIMSQFKGENGSIDINKMVGTAGQMVSVVNQVTGMVKGIGGIFKFGS